MEAGQNPGYQQNAATNTSEVQVILPPEASRTQRVNFSGLEGLGDSGEITSAINSNEVLVDDDDKGCRRPPGCRGNDFPRVPTKLSFAQKVIGGSGHILNDLCASLWFTYFLLYMQKVAGFSDRSAAALMLLGQVVDGVSTPLIGFEADRVNHCYLCRKGYGRCKSWHLVGVILVMISFPFVFSPCIGCEHSDEWARAVYYAPFIAIFQIGWAASQISHLALIPKMTMDILIRTEVLAIRYAFTVMANIAVFLLTWLTLGFSDCEIDSEDAPTFQLLALVSVGIGGTFSLLFHLFVVERTDEEIRRANLLYETEDVPISEQEQRQELVDSLNTVTNVKSVASSMAISKVQAQARRRRTSSMSSRNSAGEAGQSLLADQDHPRSIYTEDDSTISGSLTRSSLTQIRTSVIQSGVDSRQGYSMQSLSLGKESVTVTEWLMMPQFYIVAVMYMGTRLSVNITQAYMPLYLQETLKLPCGSVATIPLTMYCSGFFVSIFIKLINKHLGRQLAYGLGAVLCITGAGLILYLDWTPGTVLAEKGIYGIAVLLGGGASAILVTSLSITADMIGNNVESGAFVYGAMSFCDKLSCGLAVMLINELKMVYKDPAFYQRVLGYTAGGCSMLGVLGVIGLTYIIYRQRKNTNEL